MIGSIALVSGLLVFLVLPIIALLQYYSPKKYSFWMNVFWITIGVISWPLFPLILSIKNKNKILNILFGVAFIIWVISINMWLVANLNTVLEILNGYRNNQMKTA